MLAILGFFLLQVEIIAGIPLGGSNIVKGSQPSQPSPTMHSTVRDDALQEHIFFRDNGIEITVYYPKTVYAGQTFILKATMRNNKAYARMGGLTLSFPQMTDVGGRILNSTFDDLTGYKPYSKVYSRIRGGNISSQYFMIEGWEKKWSYGSERHMKLLLAAPNVTGNFYVNARGVLHLGRNKNNTYEVVIPAYSNTTDQQGYATRQFIIKIKR